MKGYLTQQGTWDMSPARDISFFYAKKIMRNFIKLTKRRENNIMATWQKEIMVLANDFCLNMEKVKGIVDGGCGRFLGLAKLLTRDFVRTPGSNSTEYRHYHGFSVLPVLCN